jgi:hypothetical protein
MKIVLTFFTPALLLTLALLLVPGGTTPAAPSRPDLPDEPSTHEVPETAPLDCAGADPSIEETAEADDAPDATAVAEAKTPADEMKALVTYLGACAKAPEGETPSATLDEVAELIDARPETAEILVAAMDGASPRLRTWLGHIVYRVKDKTLRSSLKRKWREADPVRRRVEAILAEPATIPAALADMDPPTPLIQRLTKDHLKDPAIRAALRVVAESSSDDRARATAMYRLGRAGTPDAEAFVLGVVEDSNRSLADRRSAVGAVRGNLSARAIEVLVNVVETETDRALLANAAWNLSDVVDKKNVSSALFDLLLSSGSETGARKAAADSLAEGIGTLEGEPRAALETRVEGALVDLGRNESTRDLYEYALSQFADSLGAEFRARVTAGAGSVAQATVSHD